jgi:hypothetical protein
MLAKSKRSAFLLSLAAVLAFAAADAAINILLPGLTGQSPPQLSNDPGLAQQGAILGLLALITIAAVGLLSVIGMVWLYRFFGERYYGRRGLAFWALFGALLAVCLELPALLMGERLPWIQDILQFVSAIPAFFAARWVTRV